jgi:hypothetical protein
MKKIAFFVLAAGVLTAAGCAGKPRSLSGLEAVPLRVEETEAYEVVDHKNKALGQDVPEWIIRYTDGGLAEIEELFSYSGKYVFMGENSGTNLNALRQWLSGFSVTRDLPRLVSTRVQARFTRAAPGNPDEVYGRYFENMIKNTSDAAYKGAQRETDFWLLKRYFEEDGTTTSREAYGFYVLISINKELLKQQVNHVLDLVTVDTPLTREQSAAINRVRETLYEGF